MADYEPTGEQSAILGHPYGEHARVLAGPGTGKSATVVALLTNLLGSEEPPRVRLMTFTRAATAELAQKVEDQPEAAVERPSTVHSFAIASLLRNPGSADFPEPLRIADDWELANLVIPQLAKMTGVQSRDVKNRLLPEMAANWESLEEQHDPEIDEQLRSRFLGAWEQHRRVFGYTLLAELPDLLRRALETHEDLDGVDYDLLVVDEYQDLNACDLRVLRLLADRGTAILAIGDDEQSIYGFRKAAPEGILRFVEDYPGSNDYPLTISHRCGARIIEWARYVIEAEPDRDHDRPRLQASDSAESGECALLSFSSENQEATGVAALIQNLINLEGLEPFEIAVLLRSDHNSSFTRPIKEQLATAGVPVADPAWVAQLLDQDENRRAILALRLIGNRQDSLAWTGLLKLAPGIGPAFMNPIYDSAVQNNQTFAEALITSYEAGFPEIPTAPRNKAKELLDEMMLWLDGTELPDTGEGIEWGAWISDSLESSEIITLTDELEDLFSLVDGLIEDEDMNLGRYLSMVQPLAKDHAQASSDGVRFMTMSSSKGLTVTAAIVVAAEDGIIPRSTEDVSEARRLMYVAMTRARKYQYVTFATRRTGPTARAGDAKVQGRRSVSRYLLRGPVEVEAGPSFIQRRWNSEA